MADNTRSQIQAVTDKCWLYYTDLDKNDQGTLKVFGKISIDENENAFLNKTRHQLGYTGFCALYNMQTIAYNKWKTDIDALDVQLDSMLSHKMDIGGSQKGGADCPENFQKIFNYMFLIAASASIAVMSPDIGLVANVCMNALKLLFKITDPIINLLRVIFLFMLQSLVSIVKTAKDVAIGLISNLIKTFYLNINTIAPAAIGIAKVFIYASLTYCGSFYNNAFAAMQTTSTTATTSTKIADVDDLKDNDGNNLPEPKVSDITHENITDINKSLQEAVKTEFFADDATIVITAEHDIFMVMLTIVGNTIDAIRNQIEFGHIFLKTAYDLLCAKADNNLVSILGSQYSANRAKLLLTKLLLNVEILLSRTIGTVVNLDKIILHQINVSIISVIRLLYPKNDAMRKELIMESKTKLNKAIGKENKEAKNDISIALLENDIKEQVSKTDINVEELTGNIRSILKNPKKLYTTENYSKIILPVLDQDQKNIEKIIAENVKRGITEGGSKKKTPKRKTKKAKKRGNKRRYSRKP